MSEGSRNDISELLVAWGDGDEAALERLMPLVYDELKRLAHRYMRGERVGHTLQTTALVNEAYLRLAKWKDVHWQNRAQFFAVSAQMMRRILVDFARERQYQKRGGGALQVSLSEAAAFAEDRKQISLRWTKPLRPWRRSIYEKPRWWKCVSLVAFQSRRLPRF